MLTIGVDAQKRVHQAVALDERGQVRASWRGANAPECWAQLQRWAEGLADARRWGIEGAYTCGHGVERRKGVSGKTRECVSRHAGMLSVAAAALVHVKSQAVDHVSRETEVTCPTFEQALCL
jgi:hypothetical protein